MSNEEQPILSLTSFDYENKIKFRRFAIAFLFIVSNFLGTVCFFILKFLTFQTLRNKCAWSEVLINFVKTNDSIFLIYMSFFGGLFTDFLCTKFVLVFINYISLIVGSGYFSLWKNHICNNGTNGNLTVFSPYESDIEGNSGILSIFSLFFVWFGNGIILPIYFAAGCSQIKFYGVRIVSIYLFVSYATRILAQMVSRVATSQILSDEGFFVLFGITFGTYFILFNIALALGEKQNDKMSFFVFLGEIKKLAISNLSRRHTARQLSTRNTVTFHSEDNNLSSDLHDGVKRLMCHVPLFCILVLPGCVLLNMISSINLQTFYMAAVPKWFWDDFLNFRSNLMVINLNILDEASIVIGTAVIVVILVKYCQPNQVMSFQIRIILGTGLAVLSIFYSGIIESIRLNIFWGPGYDSLNHSSNVHSYTRDNKTFYATNMSMFYLCPPVIALGLSEILIQVTALEYSYLNSPTWLRYTAVGISQLSMGTGLFASWPFGNGLHAVLYNITDLDYRSPCPNVNGTDSHQNVCWHSRLDIAYYIIAVAMFVLFIIILFGIRRMLPDFFRIPFWDYRVNDDEHNNRSDSHIDRFPNRECANIADSLLSEEYYGT